MSLVNSVRAAGHCRITCNQRAQIVPYAIPRASKLRGKFPQRLLMASPRLHPDLRSTNLLLQLADLTLLEFPQRSSVLTQPYYIQMAGLLHLMTRHYHFECPAKKFNGTRLAAFITRRCDFGT